MNDLVDQLIGHGGAGSGWHDDAGVVLLACAAALFVVAGVVRLARWRLVGDPHSLLVGSALILIGGIGLPLVGVAAVAGALHHRQLAEAVVRAMASFITVGLVCRALRATTVRWARPSRLLPLLASLFLVSFAGLAALEASRSAPLPGGPQIARTLSGAMVLGWLALAVAVRTSSVGRPWSRRAMPLILGLGIAEASYGADLGALGTAGSLLLCSAVAVLCVRSAHLDLTEALLQTEHTMGSLGRALVDVRQEAVELSQWRAGLVHDATNAVAGLRAALDVIDAHQGPADTPTTRLCRAAVEEVAHLDHLLHGSPDVPTRPFDVGTVVLGVGESARALGDPVTAAAGPVLAVGRPADLVAVLKNLLVNARHHAPGAAVELLVEEQGGEVRVICRDHGPGLDPLGAAVAFERGYRSAASEGSGLGLHRARLLMRAQGGDLVLEPRSRGACFVATLPRYVGPAVRIPEQRTGSVQPRRVEHRLGTMS